MRLLLHILGALCEANICEFNSEPREMSPVVSELLLPRKCHLLDLSVSVVLSTSVLEFKANFISLGLIHFWNKWKVSSQGREVRVLVDPQSLNTHSRIMNMGLMVFN